MYLVPLNIFFSRLSMEGVTKKKGIQTCSSAVPFRNNCFLFAGQTAAVVLESRLVTSLQAHARSVNPPPSLLLWNCQLCLSSWYQIYLLGHSAKSRNKTFFKVRRLVQWHMSHSIFLLYFFPFYYFSKNLRTLQVFVLHSQDKFHHCVLKLLQQMGVWGVKCE